ncbi:MAG: helix-turn-helix domain-containing protein [Acidobacteria bacterium]|nr:helix-turn-helix domain-containing protein [Acidobacteriota bacterium]
MPRSLKVRQPKAAELRQLQALLDHEPDRRQARRAEAILLYAAEMEAVEIAQVLAAHANTIYADLHAFERDGLDCVQDAQRLAHWCGLTPARVRAICQLAEQPPYELGLPYGRWSLAKLRAYLLEERFCRHLSREHLRRLLKKGASAYGACGARSSATIRSGERF